MAGYLFTHFIGENAESEEQIYFSVSADGLHWQDLNDSKPILTSGIGTKGVRDPFLVRHPQTGRYYLMATDLSIYRSPDWDKAQFAGSRSLIVWESDDLISWSSPVSREVGVEGTGCVWAPEAIWDEEQFLVFWASMISAEGDKEPKQRIYAAHTADFSSFSAPFVYAQSEKHLIDMSIVKDGAWYYRFIKDETDKCVRIERLRHLRGEADSVPSELLAGLFGVEGPECYRLADGRWCLIVDRFGSGQGYMPLLTKQLASGHFEILRPEQYNFGRTKKRHGGVIKISQDDMERLLKAFGQNPSSQQIYPS